MLGRTWRLDNGFVVRLRLARRGDTAAVRDLLRRCGADASELAVERIVRQDPRRGVAICAAAPVDGHDEVVGVGAIQYDRGGPHVVACDARMDADGARLVNDALRELVRRRARRVA